MSTLSIVIPAYNEQPRLPRTLDLIYEGIQSGEFADFQISQILIVNDGSTDQTSATALRYLLSAQRPGQPERQSAP